MLDHVGRRGDDEVDAVEHALEERAGTPASSALLPHDVAVVGEHAWARPGCARSQRQLAPRVREVEVEDVGRRRRRASRRASSPAIASATGALESANCARQARDLDAVDRLLDARRGPRWQTMRAHLRARVLDEPLGEVADVVSMPPRCGGSSTC